MQHLQHRRALTVGRQLVHIVAAIIDGKRRHPFAVMGREILITQIAADALEIGVHGVRDLTFVEGVAAVLGEQRIACARDRDCGRFRLPRAYGRRRVSRARVVEFLDQTLVLLERGHVVLPVERDELRDGKAVVRVADGRREVFGHGQLAELAVQCEPAIDRARHCDRQRAHRRDMRLWVLGPRFLYAASTSAFIFARSRPIGARPEPL